MRNKREKEIRVICPIVGLTNGLWKYISAICVCLMLTLVIPSYAQDSESSASTSAFESLVNFDGINGRNPISPLVQGPNGYLYGVTGLGGGNDTGTMFKMTPSGSMTVLYTFCALTKCADGSGPQALLLGTDGNFYGTTSAGGASGSGTVFKFTPSGTLTTVYNFCTQPNCADGGPLSGLVQGTDGNFYGTTFEGGTYNQGTAYGVTPSGNFTTIHSFCTLPNCEDGANPTTPLVQGADGDLYGTTPGAGVHNGGTIFKTTPEGAFTVLHTFCIANCPNGLGPNGLVQATDGNFYGTTVAGGSSLFCQTITPPGCGTIFKITPSGTLTTLHLFDGTDGAEASSGLVHYTNGMLYGTTFLGGIKNPPCTLGCGNVFRISVGLGIFVETVPTASKAGEPVQILGTNLTGATGVSFSGTATAFKVVDSALVLAVVPTGATTGFVTVTTPAGALTSNTNFMVLP